MANNVGGHLLNSYAILSIFVLVMSFSVKATQDDDRKVHIVYLGSLPDDRAYSPLSHHLSILQRVVQGSPPENLLVRTYKRSLNGFAANLTDQEREKLGNMKEVVSVFPSTIYKLQTTRSWDFIGLSEKSARNLTVESDIIIGMLDSGIWPESDSFKDEGFGPAPKKWNGTCNGGKNFTCNNKVIGARYYIAESARDVYGHGTHTASIAAGNAVKDVDFYGLAKGTARGGVPAARIAAYKICDPQGCRPEDILAAFDDAIADGVDIISISIGAGPFELYKDVIAIGSFHALKKGILTSQSAGNDGPRFGTVTSTSPWLLTVGASKTDRGIINKLVLANGKALVGNGVNTFTLNGTSFPLINGADAARKNCSGLFNELCMDGCVDSDKVKGKIVVCYSENGDIAAHRAHALGSVLYNYAGTKLKFYDSFQVPLVPAAILLEEDYDVVLSYMNSTRNPQANILKSEVIKDAAAPTVPYFSSVGPNIILNNIIKPDISAPGVEIVAAYSPIGSITVRSSEDERRVKYNMVSGTSMSTPHASGAAAYVKAFHPSWSPEAVKSALMTTAWPMNDTRYFTAEFAYGAGNINPVKAVNPGLVYEASGEDYIKLLCTMYDEGKVRLISGDNSTCPPKGSNDDKGFQKDLNYPSMGARVEYFKPYTVKFPRRVKNVGLANSTYKAKIFSTNSTVVDIKVVPEILSFVSLNEEKTFEVTVVGSASKTIDSLVSASLVWSDGIHNVRSPIVVYSY